MANEKNINSRIVNKHDTEANWNRATTFIPRAGEIIVYDIDDEYSTERIKIGDGINLVKDLPFVNDDIRKDLNILLEKPTEGLEYILSEDGTYYICDGGNVMGDIIIPSIYNGLPVTEITEQAFYGDRRGYKNLTSVIIPASIKKINYGAFDAQWRLGKIICKGTPEYINPGAFSTNSLAEGYEESVVPLEIYVPFAENVIEGAPWGNENAIVHYNAPESKDFFGLTPIVGKEVNLKTSSITPKSGQLVIYEPDENYTYYRIKTGDGVTALKDFGTLALSALPSVQSLDETRFRSYTADYVNDNGEIVDFDGNPSTETAEAEYYLNLNLYKAFKTKNRVYVERGNNSSGKWRGPYPMYTLSYDGSSLKNPWLYKETWYKIYFNKNSSNLAYATADEYIAAITAGNETPPSAPKANDFIGLDSIVQRTGDSEGALPGAAGHIRIPARTIDELDALTLDKSLVNEFAITRKYADSAITRYNDKTIVPFVNNQIDTKIAFITDDLQDEQIYVDSHNGTYSKISFNLQRRDLGTIGADYDYAGSVFRTYLTFDGRTRGGSGIQFEIWDGSNRSFQVLLGDGVVQTNYGYNKNDPNYSKDSYVKVVKVPELIGNGTILLEIIHNYSTDLRGMIGLRINGKLIVECPRWENGGGSIMSLAATGGTTGKIYLTNTAFYESILDYAPDEGYAYQAVPETASSDYFDLLTIGIGNLPYNSSPIYVNGTYADTWQIIKRDNNKDVSTKGYVNNYVDKSIQDIFNRDIKTSGKITLGKDASENMDAVALHQLSSLNDELNTKIIEQSNEITNLNSYIQNELLKVQNTCKDLIAYGGNLKGSEGLTYEISADGTYAICTGETTSGGIKKIATTYENLPVTEIGERAFVSSSSDIYLPTTINKVGSGAFNAPSAKIHIVDLASYLKIDFADSYATSPFTRVSKSNIYIENDTSGNLVIPEGVTEIKMRAFQSSSTAPYIKSIKFPSTLTKIGTLAFSAIGVSELRIPANITEIREGAFEVAPNLTTVYFEGIPTDLSGSTFQNSKKIKNIYVPWSKGEVDGAPWSATNATIYYYSETMPTESGNFWHYVDGIPTVWPPYRKILDTNLTLFSASPSNETTSEITEWVQNGEQISIKKYIPGGDGYIYLDINISNRTLENLSLKNAVGNIKETYDSHSSSGSKITYRAYSSEDDFDSDLKQLLSGAEFYYYTPTPGGEDEKIIGSGIDEIPESTTCYFDLDQLSYGQYETKTVTNYTYDNHFEYYAYPSGGTLRDAQIKHISSGNVYYWNNSYFPSWEYTESNSNIERKYISDWVDLIGSDPFISFIFSNLIAQNIDLRTNSIDITEYFEISYSEMK